MQDTSSKVANRRTVPKSSTTAPTSSSESQDRFLGQHDQKSDSVSSIHGDVLLDSSAAADIDTALSQLGEREFAPMQYSGVNLIDEEQVLFAPERNKRIVSDTSLQARRSPLTDTSTTQTEATGKKSALSAFVCKAGITKTLEEVMPATLRSCLEKATTLKQIPTDLQVQRQISRNSIEFQMKDVQKTVTAVCESFESKLPNEQKESEKIPDVETEETKTWGKIVDELQVTALRFLCGREFDENFHVQQNRAICSITLREASSLDLVSKVESLRREDALLSASEVSSLGDTVNVRSEGIEAFIKIVPDQNKAVIFAFDHRAVTKAKHLLTVKTGRVKVTARSRRRFDAGDPGATNSLQDQSPPQSVTSVSPQSGPSRTTTDFMTRTGIKVSVYKTDITKLPVEAIVNAANESLSHGEGVAAAIARAAGYSLEDEGQNYIQRCGPLKVSEVAVTTGGSLPCQKVLHAVGPRWHDYIDKGQCQHLLIGTVFNCLHKAASLGFPSIAIPSISSGTVASLNIVLARIYNNGALG